MDLATTYLGLSLRNPLVASASPLSQSADRVIELVEAGVSAVVLHSLFEEQIEHPTPDADLRHFFVNPAGPGAPRRYLDLIEECVESVDVPVIASINGTSRHGWTSFAPHMQDAGAAAVECNFYNVPQRMQGRRRGASLRVGRSMVRQPPRSQVWGEGVSSASSSPRDAMIPHRMLRAARSRSRTSGALIE